MNTPNDIASFTERLILIRRYRRASGITTRKAELSILSRLAPGEQGVMAAVAAAEAFERNALYRNPRGGAQ